MQTFLPFSNFTKSAKCLDRQRLGKQRVECKQILTALESKRSGRKAGWQNHPATRMWERQEAALCCYAIDICQEWLNRGYKDSLLSWFENYRELLRSCGADPEDRPQWLGDERLHASHRGRLLFKDPVHYGQFGWTDTPRSDTEGYWWPV